MMKWVVTCGRKLGEVIGDGAGEWGWLEAKNKGRDRA